MVREEEKFMDKFIYVASIVYPLMTLPQVYEIFVTRNVAGVSLVTWASYLVFTVIFLIYALNKRIRPLALSYVLWLIVETAVVVGIVMYR